MKKILICCAIILSQVFTGNAAANEFAKQEAMLILMAGISAKQPELAAAVDVLALLAVPSAPEYQTDWERTVAYVGLTALALYNYDAEDEDRSEEEIFNTNFVMFNIILAGYLFGSDDSASSLIERDQPASRFNLQLSPDGGPRASWRYSFD